MTSSSFSETSLPHLLSDVTCQGSETNVLQCQYSTVVSCGSNEDAEVVCQGGLSMCTQQYSVTSDWGSQECMLIDAGAKRGEVGGLSRKVICSWIASM